MNLARDTTAQEADGRTLGARHVLGLTLIILLLIAGTLGVRHLALDPVSQTGAVASDGTRASSPREATGQVPGTRSAAPAVDRGVSRTSRTRGGAVAAGAEYATLLSRLWPLPAAKARAVAADAATDAERDDLVRSIDRQLIPLQEQARELGGTTSYRQSVLATKLLSYHEPMGEGRYRAQVSVWLMLTVSQVAGSPSEAARMPEAQSTFSTVRLDLTWERGAWRLTDDRTTEGPTPAVEGSAVSGAELGQRLSGFQDWRPW